MDRESAEQWNAKNSNGTIVSVRLRSGQTVSAPTATHAQQWGDFALVTPAGVTGLWITDALTIALHPGK
jgi:hypothetical protein